MVVVSRASPGIVDPLTVCVYTRLGALCVTTVGPYYTFEVPGRLLDIVVQEPPVPLPLAVIIDLGDGNYATHRERDRWYRRRRGIRNVMITNQWQQFFRQGYSSDSDGDSSSDSDSD
jgi:hypothetical protein